MKSPHMHISQLFSLLAVILIATAGAWAGAAKSPSGTTEILRLQERITREMRSNQLIATGEAGIPGRLLLPETMNPAAPRAGDGLSVLGLDTSVIYSSWDTTRYLYVYNNQGQQAAQVWQTFWGGSWVNHALYNYSYDENGHETLYVARDWDTDHWVNAYQGAFAYAPQGRIVSSVYSQWSASGLRPMWRDTYTYDDNGQQSSYLDEIWNGVEWIPMYRFMYSYQYTGHLVVTLYQQFLDGQWENSSRYTTEYDNQMNQLSYLQEEARPNNLWSNAYRENFTYDSQAHLLESIVDTWLNNVLNSTHRLTYSYDQAWRLLRVNEQEYINNLWKNLGLTTYEYGPQGTTSSGWHYQWADTGWTPSDGTILVTNGYRGYGYNAMHITATWKYITTAVGQVPNLVPAGFALAQNYPNPFNPSTVIRYQLPVESYVRHTISNILGQEVRTLADGIQQAGEKAVAFDATGLPSGMYFYRLDATSTADPATHFSQTMRMLLVK